MKKLLPFIICAVVLYACNNQTKTTEKEYFAQSYELGGPTGKDTINLIDANGYKQGLWIMRNRKDTMVYKNDTGYSTKGYTYGEVVRMLQSGNKGLFITYDSLTVRSH